ncbi:MULTISPECIES: ABC transporter permease [unclassified Agarivorans]|uniref:ABC transporter permease n=1 Tax=unclassified Agarivorans TaxID=2636026 RepID=UPI0026E3CC56|nr:MULTISPECIES: ABC transporter permease [unclassified Agarivorans]MDO6685553.1 ABC transporter permease [Agarivorans sp. 3_MG-2023]MDO6715939.1 ABC transporter permease [Agarivorans sp. 2_MG-2023]
MSWWVLLRLELRRILANRALLLTVFGGLLLYAFLYPQPYIKQTSLQQPITVINADGSQLSRQLIRMVNASPLLEVTSQVASIEQAQQLLVERKVGGLLVIPENFYRDVLMGRSPTLSYAGDASYFLVYGTIVQGLAETSATLAAQVKVAKMVVDGVPISLASQLHSPVQLSTNAAFNAHQGYLDYVIPAVFIVILHQTLLIAIGLHASPTKPAIKPNLVRFFPAWKIVVVRSILFVAIYWLMSSFYIGVVLDYYGVHHWANVADIYKLLLPFLLAASGLAMCIASLLPKRDYATIVGLMTSLPIVFACGFIWPLSSIPMPINIIADLIPAKPMVLGMLKMNQMGASFSEIQHHFIHLWSLAGCYFALAVAMVYWQSTSTPKVDAAKSALPSSLSE